MYSTAEAVLEMIKPSAIGGLIDDQYIADPDERRQQILPIIEAAIADADGEIDGYLMGRYPVPLSSPAAMISKVSKDIAAYNVFSRIGIKEDGEEKNYLTRYQAAIRFLAMVAEGKISLGVPGGSAVAAAHAGDYQISSNKKIFGRRQMEGM
ncbi:MAG: DUF1320 domain-containing protein [Peptococcaceae bacterium]|nr:DUF1320 domain-containing protein [Peptococcaceae bacterium]